MPRPKVLARAGCPPLYVNRSRFSGFGVENALGLGQRMPVCFGMFRCMRAAFASRKWPGAGCVVYSILVASRRQHQNNDASSSTSPSGPTGSEAGSLPGGTSIQQAEDAARKHQSSDHVRSRPEGLLLAKAQ
eukprot:385038-Amphidinium_carterae.1